MHLIKKKKKCSHRWRHLLSVSDSVTFELILSPLLSSSLVVLEFLYLSYPYRDIKQALFSSVLIILCRRNPWSKDTRQ